MYRLVLEVIDCYSKSISTDQLKNKTAIHFDILKSTKYIPNIIQTHHKPEFFNRIFSELFKTYNVNHYSTYSINKASIVERIIRSIKPWFYVEFLSRGKYLWVDIIQKITSRYKVYRKIGKNLADVTFTK